MAAGRLKQEDKIQRVIGRLLERYPRFARYYRIAYDAQRHALSWQRQANKKAIAGKLDGSYILKTERQDPTADEIWRTYIVLTSRSVCVHNRKVIDRSDDLNRAGSSERRDKVLAATEDFPFVATDNCTLSGFWRA